VALGQTIWADVEVTKNMGTLGPATLGPWDGGMLIP